MTPSQHNTLARPVERILTITRRTPESDTSALLQEIDRLVYSRYDLTPEEIKLVEKRGQR